MSPFWYDRSPSCSNDAKRLLIQKQYQFIIAWRSFFITDRFFWIFHVKFGENTVPLFPLFLPFTLMAKISIQIRQKVIYDCKSRRYLFSDDFWTISLNNDHHLCIYRIGLRCQQDWLLLLQWKKWVIKLGMDPLLTAIRR